MKQKVFFALLTVLVLALLAFPLVAQEAVELRITWYNDGVEGEVLRDLLDRYEAEHPGVTVVVDTIPYADLDTTLQPQVETGNGPDMARVTDVARYKPYYLDMRPYMTDADAWEANWPPAIINWMQKDAEDNGLYGFMTNATVTGPYINRTLFEQAGVPVPSDEKAEVTWDEWIAAAKQVAEAVSSPDNVVYAVGMDRSGHRFWGPALSNGATFAQFDENGSAVMDENGNVIYTVDSPGFRKTAQMLVDWHTEGVTPAEVWAGSGGSYADVRSFFANGQLVLYMSGSWQISYFATNIGDAWDWEAVPNPCGEGGCTGMPGGAALMAFSDTDHPEEVTALMEYLSSDEVLTEFAARTLFPNYDVRLSEHGVEFETDLPAAKESLDVFAAEIPHISDEAWVLQTAKNSFALNIGIRERLTQVITGELTLDEAIARIQEEVDEAMAAS